MKRLCCFLILLPVLLSGGCTTRALWEEDRFAHYYEPANPSHLALARAQSETPVLVQYDETRESHETIKRRAYWLTDKTATATNPFKPEFVSPPSQLTPIPIFDSASDIPPQSTGLCAVSPTNSDDFTLYSGELKLGTHDLPVYQDTSGKTKQVLLTPFALAIDATIVGGIIVYWWLNSGAPGLSEALY